MVDRILGWVIHWLVTPVWLANFVRRNRMLRSVLLGLSLVVFVLYRLGGWQLVFTIGMMLGQLMFGFLFIMVQFIGLFYFLGRTKATIILPGDEKAVTLDDYWGNPHVVEEVTQWNKLLTDRGRFREMGGRPISGMLLVGPPGTGKTYLAKAMAGTERVAFYGMDGSGFRAMFIGIDILKMRGFFGKLRELAKQHGACIGYLDEIDAIGATRGNVMGDGERAASEFGQVIRELGLVRKMVMGGMMGGGSGALTRLLYELDGIDEPSDREKLENKVRRWLGVPAIERGVVMLMGSTNRPDVLDSALTRPGRLDKTIVVGIPDKASRRQMIRGYLGQVLHESGMDVEVLVESTPRATPAQIMGAITKDAVRRAFFAGRELVTQADIIHAFQEQVLGLENPIAEFDPRQRSQVAVHEAGHALASYIFQPYRMVVYASIVRRGQALGYVMDMDKEDVYAMPLEHLQDHIRVSVAGHVATQVVLGELWTGAAGDVRSIRRLMLALWAHGAFGGLPITLEPTAEQQEEMERRLAVLTDQTKAALDANKAALVALSEALLEHGSLTGPEVVAIMGREGVER